MIINPTILLILVSFHLPIHVVQHSQQRECLLAGRTKKDLFFSKISKQATSPTHSAIQLLPQTIFLNGRGTSVTTQLYLLCG